MSRSATLTHQPEGARNPVPDVLSSSEGQAVAATGVAAAAVSVVAGPGAAVTANRALVTAQLLRCNALKGVGADLDAPEITEHPLRVGLGTGPLRLFRGAAILNVALLAAAACLALVVHFMVRVVVLNRAATFLAAMLWAVLTTPTFRACTILVRFDSVVFQAVAVLVMVVLVGAAAGLHFMFLQRINPRLFPLTQVVGGLQRFACPMQEWRDDTMISWLEDPEAPPGVPYRARLGRFHEDYTRIPFMSWEWVFSAVAGVLAGLRPSSSGGCQALATATCLLYGAYAVVCIGCRYFIVRSKLVAMCAVALLQCAGMAAVVVWTFEGRSTLTSTVVAFCIVLSEAVSALEQVVETAAWLIYNHAATLAALTVASSSDEASETVTTTEDGCVLAYPLLHQDTPQASDVASSMEKDADSL